MIRADGGTALSKENASLQPILDRVLDITGVDFSAYRESTLRRRIERRVVANRCSGIDEYAALLNSVPSEPELLVRDLTINYSEFFRDQFVFDLLETSILPTLLCRCRREKRPLYIWSAGCAGGEEPYSLAAACMRISRFGPNMDGVNVLGSDLDPSAIASAEQGTYVTDLISSIPSDCDGTYFIREGQHLRASEELESAVEFTVHDLTGTDALRQMRKHRPDGFDLIACRNVLIYLNQQAQARVMELCINMLRPGGFLVLGTKERVPSALCDKLNILDAKARIYQMC
jgi:two-component system CheB/CheR fusion protein